MAADAVSGSSQNVRWTVLLGGRQICEKDVEEQNSIIARLQTIADEMLLNYQSAAFDRRLAARELCQLFPQVWEVHLFGCKVSRLLCGEQPQVIKRAIARWGRNQFSLIKTFKEIVKNEVQVTEKEHSALLENYEKMIKIYRKSRTQEDLEHLQKIKGAVNGQVRSEWRELQNYREKLGLFFFEEKIIDLAERRLLERLTALNHQT